MEAGNEQQLYLAIQLILLPINLYNFQVNSLVYQMSVIMETAWRTLQEPKVLFLTTFNLQLYKSSNIMLVDTKISPESHITPPR